MKCSLLLQLWPYCSLHVISGISINVPHRVLCSACMPQLQLHVFDVCMRNLECYACSQYGSGSIGETKPSGPGMAPYDMTLEQCCDLSPRTRTTARSWQHPCAGGTNRQCSALRPRCLWLCYSRDQPLAVEQPCMHGASTADTGTTSACCSCMQDQVLNLKEGDLPPSMMCTSRATYRIHHPAPGKGLAQRAS
jgi:hypothetical protein